MWFRQEFEYHKKQEEREEEEIMNNKHHHEDREEVVGGNDNNNGNNQHVETVSMLSFFIRQTTRQAPMKNISPSVLLKFHGKYTEYLGEFLFEFDILCRSYDYISIENTLKLFFSTMKGNSLQFFMSLGGETITTWYQMKHVFLAKYQDYCRTKDKREKLFKMVNKDDEILE